VPDTAAAHKPTIMGAAATGERADFMPGASLAAAAKARLAKHEAA